MKTERQLAIITYLLNRDLVTGKKLAEKFEVTERTIQRDIDSINMAGIPIVSFRGTNGGYKILDTYKVLKQTSTDNDYKLVRMALESLDSALDNKEISTTLEKVKSLENNKNTSNISVDFGVAKENKKVESYLKKIDSAITNKKRIKFIYVNANNYETTRIVEPIMLNFKWYAWYLLAYCSEKKDYRIFKLIRIKELNETDNPFENTHKIDSDLFEKLINNDKRKMTKITFKFNRDIYIPVTEYLINLKIIEENTKSFTGELIVIEDERLWFGLFLSFGDNVEIIKPDYMRERLKKHAENIVRKYEIPDM